MEMKCPEGDFVAKGDNEEEVKAQLKEHAKTAHNMDESKFEGVFNDIKSKITGMLHR